MILSKHPKVENSVVEISKELIPYGKSGFNIGVNFIVPSNERFVNDPSILTLSI